MNDPREALPLAAVLQVADERRRRRERVRAAAAPAAGVLVAGMASAIVVAVQIGGGARPATPISAGAPPTSARPTAAAEPAPSALLQPDLLRPGYLEDLALLAEDPAWVGQPVADALDLAAAWGVPTSPEAQAIVAKAALVGETLEVADPAAGDELAERFLQAGRTAEDAEALAEAWDTDPRSAAMLGALVDEAG